MRIKNFTTYVFLCGLCVFIDAHSDEEFRKKAFRQRRLLQKSQMGTLPNPSHQGRGLFINPLPWWERVRVRG
jgi:hypothetical protein